SRSGLPSGSIPARPTAHVDLWHSRWPLEAHGVGVVGGFDVAVGIERGVQAALGGRLVKVARQRITGAFGADAVQRGARLGWDVECRDILALEQLFDGSVHVTYLA